MGTYFLIALIVFVIEFVLIVKLLPWWLFDVEASKRTGEIEWCRECSFAFVMMLLTSAVWIITVPGGIMVGLVYIIWKTCILKFVKKSILK